MLHLPFKIFLALLAGVWLVRCTTPTQTKDANGQILAELVVE